MPNIKVKTIAPKYPYISKNYNIFSSKFVIQTNKNANKPWYTFIKNR